MIKKLTTSFALMVSATLFSQVGIQTESPQASLDVVGDPANAASLDGIIAPRIEGAQLRAKAYTPAQTGALVYVTLADTAPTGQTEDVTAEGYYYFNGSKWVIAGAGNMVNIYNSDGALTEEREVNLNGYGLNFLGFEGKTSIEDSGASISVSAQGADRAQLRLFTQDLDGDGVGSNFDIDLFTDNILQMLGNDHIEGVLFGTHSTKNSSPIEFATSPGNFADGVVRMKITGEGNVGIDANTPTERLQNAGITRLNLPLNGTANAHHTLNGGGESPYKDQTFTATRTVVADANGVLGYVTGLPASSQNIYNTDGALTSNRMLTTGNNSLTFNINSLQRTFWSPTNGSLNQMGLATSPTKHASISLTALDNNSNSVVSNLHFQIYPEQMGQIIASNDATGLSIGTNATINSAPISFTTSTGSNAAGSEKMRITGTGNVGIGTSNPTERFHLNGNARLQGLPLNGTTNAIFTTPGGGVSANQDQTFTATRTIVADNNGVLGYVTGIPSNNNIYNANGSLTSNRTLTLASRTLDFAGSIRTTSWDATGEMTIRGGSNNVSQRPALNLVAPSSDGTTNSTLRFTTGSTNTTILAGGHATALTIGTLGNDGVNRPITFLTSGTDGLSTVRMTLTGGGKLAIGSHHTPIATLHIIKTGTDLTPAIIDGCNVYENNAAAVTAGVPIGGIYRKSDGTLMVRY